MNAKLLLFSNLLITFFLMGLIWLVQMVQYPGFAKVGAEAFHTYHQLHVEHIAWVVAVPMVLELLLALGMLFIRPSQLDLILSVLLFLLVGATWVITFFVAMPYHDQLANQGFDAEIIKKLININWVRTAAWTLRGGILAFIVYRVWH
ncbi:hypothetical protein [Microscilla marina]|nr:hypothetical protein [Microscilla marina]